MAGKKELAGKYATRLRVASNKAAEVREIAREIDKLTYSESNKSISKADRLEIVAFIEIDLALQSQETDGTYGILKEADNKKYLELVKALKELLG
jgi:hypothetical protein